MNNQARRKKTGKQRALLIAGMVTLLLGVGGVGAGEPPSKAEITFDRYYTVELAGQRCGYMRTARRESKQQIVFLTYLQIAMQRSGSAIPIAVKNITRETPSGEFISSREYLNAGGMLVKKKALVESGQLVVTSELLGRETVERFEIPEAGFSTEVDLEKKFRQLLDMPGQRLEATVLSLEGGASPFVPVTVEVAGSEPIEAYGQAVLATKVISTVSINGVEFASVSWEDPKGTLASRMNFGGLELFMRAESKELAKKDSGAVDLTDWATIVPKASLKQPGKASRAVYRITVKDIRAGMIEMPQTDMQRVLSKGKDYLDVEVTRQNAERLALAQERAVPAELKSHLRSSLYLDWKTSSVSRAANEVRGDLGKPWELALELWRYVDRTIFIKNLDIYFAPASKVLSGHQGDCTEHAVLLAAMARARGLPSRLATGLTQVNRNGQDIFGYHAWTEIWIDGQWVALDAALRQAPVDVSHIALAVSAVNDSEPMADVAGGLIRAVGNLQVEVLEQE